jgi:tetratricopeptide (TPR) repeat protein
MFPEGCKEATFGVVWRCGKCGERSIDVCPTGPIDPSSSSCLNCGAVLRGATCTGCGLQRDDAAAFLHVHDRALGVEQATVAFGAGLFRHGFAVLNVLLQRDPSLLDAWTEKGKAYRSLRLNEASVTCLRRAVSLRPEPLLAIGLACALADLGRQDEAVRVYDELLSTTTTTTDARSLAIAHANRGNSHAALGHVEAAIADYEEAIRREPERVTHYQNYSVLFSSRRRWVEAHDVVVRGLAAVTGDAQVPLFLEKARTANEQEKADVGLSAADAALALAPDNARAYYQRGWALGMLGRLREAHASFRRLLELEPNNEDARSALARIEAVLPSAREARRP